MSLTKSEQETTVTGVREDGVYQVYSSNPIHIRKILREPRYRKTDEVRDEDGELIGVFAEVPFDDFDPLGGLKRKRNLSEKQRADLSARMKKLHGNKEEEEQ